MALNWSALGERGCSKGHFHRDGSETWLGISGLSLGIRTVTHDMRIPHQCPPILPKTAIALFLIMSENTPIKAVLRIGVGEGGRDWCRDGDVQVQRMPGLAVDVLNTAAWQSNEGGESPCQSLGSGRC